MRYGIWNNCRKEFQFGICATSKNKAHEELFQKIHYDAYKWRFIIKPLYWENLKARNILIQHGFAGDCEELHATKKPKKKGE